MFSIVAISILTLILVMLFVMTYRIGAIAEKGDSFGSAQDKTGWGIERMETFSGFVYTAIILVIIILLLCVYLLIKGTPWESHMMEWLNIAVRVMHITFGIAWIGASFYFVFLENALNPPENVRDELA